MAVFLNFGNYKLCELQFPEAAGKFWELKSRQLKSVIEKG